MCGGWLPRIRHVSMPLGLCICHSLHPKHPLLPTHFIWLTLTQSLRHQPPVEAFLIISWPTTTLMAAKATLRDCYHSDHSLVVLRITTLHCNCLFTCLLHSLGRKILQHLENHLIHCGCSSYVSMFIKWTDEYLNTWMKAFGPYTDIHFTDRFYHGTNLFGR